MMIVKEKNTLRIDSHPYRYFVSVLCIIIAGVVLLHGCKDLSPTVKKEQVLDTRIEQEPLQNHAETVEGFILQANRHFIHFAEQIPGFGGIFLEDMGTRLVIRTTNVTTIDRTAIENEVRRYLYEEAPIVGSAVEGGVQAMELKFKEADTCVHLNHSDSDIGNFRYLCQEMGTLFVQPGDSGSPVFAPSGPPQVTLYGIVWAMIGEGQGSVFSRITGVKEDLGQMITH